MNKNVRSENKSIVMLGIDPASKVKGGISSVVDTYRASGWFSRWRIQYVGTVASGSRVHKMRFFLSALWSYGRLVFSGRVNLVHAHTASRASFWRKSVFMLIARFADVPVILHLHGGDFENFYRLECGGLKQRFIRYVLRRVDRVVVLSSQWRARIEGIEPAAKVTVIANPVTLPSSAPPADERQSADLLFLGRFSEAKGIFDLLEACAIVKREFPAVRLRCGGEGDAARLLARARELEIEDRVHLLGWVSGAAKDRELAHAAIYVLPSYVEGLPMSVLEAMAVGTPTIASNVGGIPDVIEDGLNGLLVEPGDVQALADRILQLLRDSEFRARLGDAARAKITKGFSPELVLTQLEDLYIRLGALPRPVMLAEARPRAMSAKRSDLNIATDERHVPPRRVG